jgi:putative transposase
MARLPRYNLKGQPQHLIQRGSHQETVFWADQDYRFYLHCLQESAKRHQCAIHAYVLMPNHIHLLVTPGQAGCLSKLMQSVGRRYVQYFNTQYDRTGTLWAGRYRATLIEPATYLLTCMRYVELNPVRAKLVEHVRNYPWSSYHANALNTVDGLVTPHAQYRRLGHTKATRQAAYRKLFRARLAAADLQAIRDATNKGWVLGSERFKAKVETLSGRRAKPLPKGRPKKQ